MTADPQASDTQPPRGPQSPRRPRHLRGRRAFALIALLLGLAGFAVSATGLAIQLLPRQFTAAQQQQIANWEIASRWQQLTAGQIFPASIPYQLSPALLQDATPLSVAAMRVGVAPQSGCGAGVTTSAAATVLRRDGCQAVLRATYVDATQTYVMTVGVAVLPGDAAAKRASQSLSAAAADRRKTAPTRTRWPPASWWSGTTVPRPAFTTTAGRSPRASPRVRTWSCTPPGTRTADRACRVSPDRYSYAEMTSLASSVAQSVADTLAAPPVRPHCPGTPGC